MSSYTRFYQYTSMLLHGHFVMIMLLKNILKKRAFHWMGKRPGNLVYQLWHKNQNVHQYIFSSSMFPLSYVVYPKPILLHIISPASWLKLSSHTVPQRPSCSTSIRPDVAFSPSVNLNSGSKDKKCASVVICLSSILTRVSFNTTR